MTEDQERVVVIGAGVGGLTTAALLRQAGLPVTVLEAHVYPGGSAGTFYHQGYRFDAGATLAGGFSPGGPHARLAEILGLSWPVRPVDPAWVVHLPGKTITQWADQEQWEAERRQKLPGTEGFWRTQEMLAAQAWDIATRPFPWPPASPTDLWTLARAIRPATLQAAPYLLRTTGSLAAADDAEFCLFLDAQLLISAQATAKEANALYGSAALDLPRRGVNHVTGGIGSLARTLADWFRAHGGDLHYRQQVESIRLQKDGTAVVRTKKGMEVQAGRVVANLTPWALVELLGEDAPAGLRGKVAKTPATWGAFTLYLGLDDEALPNDTADHHQVIVDAERPLGEGNSIFLSLSGRDDASRAPAGQRAATLSTHTEIAPWWRLKETDYPAYEARRAAYAERLLAAAEGAVPGIRGAVRFCLPGTPVTFERFTRRPLGMVGGFAQKSLFAARGPGTGLENMWLVGDSVFPGQSTAGVTVGGMRVATAVLRQAGI